MTSTRVAIFKGRNVRRIVYRNEWWFSVIDVMSVLTDSNTPKRYWSDLKIKLRKEEFSEVYEKIVRLKLEAPDEKLRLTDCANTETIFRIVQTVPSPKTEPFKRWLAKEGGGVAGRARKDLEKRLKRSIVTKSNFISGNS